MKIGNKKESLLAEIALGAILIAFGAAGCVYRKVPQLIDGKVTLENFYSRAPFGEGWETYKSDSILTLTNSVSIIDSLSFKCPEGPLVSIARVNQEKQLLDSKPIPQEVEEGSFHESALKYVVKKYAKLKTRKNGPKEVEFVSSSSFTVNGYPAVEVIYDTLEKITPGCDETAGLELTEIKNKYILVKNIYKKRWGKVIGPGYPDYVVLWLAADEDLFDGVEEDFDRVVNSIQFFEK